MNLFMTSLDKSVDGTHVIRYERIRQGSFYADFRRDKRLYPEVYHCIVQREGSSEILSWSQYRSLERAIAAAEMEMKRLQESAAPKPRNPAAD